MGKRKTKAQREQEQYDALYERIYGVCCGAAGREFDDENDWLCPEELSRVIPALREMFVEVTEVETVGPGPNWKRETNGYLFSPHNLDHYDKPETIADFLWKHGVRV